MLYCRLEDYERKPMPRSIAYGIILDTEDKATMPESYEPHPFDNIQPPLFDDIQREVSENHPSLVTYELGKTILAVCSSATVNLDVLSFTYMDFPSVEPKDEDHLHSIIAEFNLPGTPKWMYLY